MDPFTGSALINLGGSFVSGLSGLFGQSSASKNALKAARETNEMNYKIWQEQKQHNIDMYEMQNEDAIEMYERQTQDSRDTWQMQFDATNAYNDPSAVMQRYRDAGLNPYLMMGAGGTAGASSASPSTTTGNYDQPGVQGSQAPTMQQPSDIAFVSPLATGIQTFLHSATSLSSVIGQLFTNEKTVAETGESFARTQFTWDQSKSQQEINKFLPERLSLERQDLRSQIRLNQMKSETEFQIQQGLIADNALKRLDLQKQQIASKYFEHQAYIDFSTSCQVWANLVMDGRVKYTTALENLSKIALNKATKDYTESLKEGQDIANTDAWMESYTKWDTPIYTDANGNIFDSEGNPFGSDTGYSIPRSLAIKQLVNAQFQNELGQLKLQLQLNSIDLGKATYAQRKEWPEWLRYGSVAVGDLLRGLAGGLIAPYQGFNIGTNAVAQPKFKPPAKVGFIR